MDLSDYIKAERGNATKLAAGISVSPSYLSQMASPGGAAISPARCVLIEHLSDRRVRRWNLRKADWHLIWPELIGTEGAPEVPVAEKAGA